MKAFEKRTIDAWYLQKTTKKGLSVMKSVKISETLNELLKKVGNITHKDLVNKFLEEYKDLLDYIEYIQDSYPEINSEIIDYSEN